MITMKILGTEEIIANTVRMRRALEGAAGKALNSRVLRIRRTAILMTPKVTGDLISSCFAIGTQGGVIAGASPTFLGYSPADPARLQADHAEAIAVESRAVLLKRKIGVISVAVGYSAYYAAYVHEDPNAGKGKNRNHRNKKKRSSSRGQWKFLETAAQATFKWIYLDIKEEFRKEFR